MAHGEPSGQQPLDFEVELGVTDNAYLLHETPAHSGAAKLQLDQATLVCFIAWQSWSKASVPLYEVLKHLKMEAVVRRAGALEELLKEPEQASRLDNFLEV